MSLTGNSFTRIAKFPIRPGRRHTNSLASEWQVFALVAWLSSAQDREKLGGIAFAFIQRQRFHARSLF
jgi:hypothetical protein